MDLEKKMELVKNGFSEKMDLGVGKVDLRCRAAVGAENWICGGGARRRAAGVGRGGRKSGFTLPRGGRRRKLDLRWRRAAARGGGWGSFIMYKWI